MNKRIFIIIIAIIVIIGGIIGVSIWLSFLRNTPPVTPSVQISTVSDSSIKEAISQKLSQDGLNYTSDEIKISKKKKIIEQAWMIVSATITSLSQTDEARQMIYVLQIKDGVPIVIAYSGDGFSMNAFPTDIPDIVIQEADKPW